MGEIVDFRNRPTSVTCECGGQWFHTQVVIDVETKRVTGYSVSQTRCASCGKRALIGGA